MKKIIILLLGIFLFTGCDLLKKEEVPDGYTKVNYLSYGQIDADKIAYRSMLITTYNKYKEVIKHYDVKNKLKEEDFKNNNYVVVIGEDKYCEGKIEELKGIKLYDDYISVKFKITQTCDECSNRYYLYLVEVSKKELSEEKEVKYEYEPINEVYCEE
jgi:hypothetical protein